MMSGEIQNQVRIIEDKTTYRTLRIRIIEPMKLLTPIS
jgi:hypothetical protein